MPYSKPLKEKCFVECTKEYFTCLQCDKTYTNETGLRLHNKSQHNGENGPTRMNKDKSPFYCASL